MGSEYISEVGQKALKENHVLLIETIDTIYIQPYFYQNGFLEEPIFMQNSGTRQARAEWFMKRVYDNQLELAQFLEGISEVYPFLINIIKKTYERIKNCESSNFDKKTRSSSLGPKNRRFECLELRHKLKRLGQNGNMYQYRTIFAQIQTEWKEWNGKKHQDPEETMTLADKYFMILDAECERRRTQMDRNLHLDDKLFQNLLKMRFHCTSPCIPEAMWIARYASAKLMAGESVHFCLKMLMDAKDKMTLYPPCRESGVILYIEYNMNCQLREQKKDSVSKDYLINLAETSLKHLTQETAEMGSDFRRMILIKITVQCLNIGLFYNFLDGDDVSEEHLRKATEALDYLDNHSPWARMENRWKSSYFVCRSKLSIISGRPDIGYMFLKHAKSFAESALLTKEILNIKENFKSHDLYINNYKPVITHKGIFANLLCILYYFLVVSIFYILYINL